MAEDFNKYFSSTSTHAPEIPLDAFTPLDEGMPVLDSLVLCEDEVYKGLLNLNPSKAPDLGGLPTIVLKSCARELTPLCGLFDSSLAEGRPPTEWKDALVSLSIRRFWGKGERWKRQKERAEGEKRLTQMLLLEPSTPTQHDSISSNQNHFRSFGCQLHVSKSSPKINLTLRFGRGPVFVLLRFRFFLNLQ